MSTLHKNTARLKMASKTKSSCRMRTGWEPRPKMMTPQVGRNGLAVRALRREGDVRGARSSNDIQVNSLSSASDFVEQNRLFEALVKGLQKRQEADPEFLFKLVWEVVQDQGIIVLTLLSSIGLPTFWSPEQFAHALLLHSTALLNDILLVYFLASTGEKFKGAAHMFEPGLDAEERLGIWTKKFKLYSCCGVATACISSLALMKFVPLNLAKFARVGLVGLIHLGISANTRYQLINGADLLYYRMFDKKTARCCTVATRVLNQIAGGRLFLLLSSII